MRNYMSEIKHRLFKRKIYHVYIKLPPFSLQYDILDTHGERDYTDWVFVRNT